jgi:outer membrane receptor protein involved in Fe transport
MASAATLGLGAALPIPGRAEDAEAAPAPSPEVEVIVITARKRDERLQDVPVSITQLSGADLDAQRIDNTLEIQFQTPNLSFGRKNIAGSNLQIRGIGKSVEAPSSDDGVAVHVNEVPLTNSRIFEQEFFDVSRIEVLRGPQGTLFGRNSTGGSFNVYTQKPSYRLETWGDFSVGDPLFFRTRGGANVPIGDRVRARVVGMYHNRDGFIDNRFTDNDIDDRELWAVRGSLQVDLGDDTIADVMVSYFREDDRRSRIGKQLCVKDDRPSPYSLGCADGDLAFEVFNTTADLGGIIDSYALESFEPVFQRSPLALYPPGADANADSVNPRDLRVHDSRFDPSYFADELLVILDLRHAFDDLTLSWLSGYQNTELDSKQDFTMARPSLAWDPAAIANLAELGFETAAGGTQLCLGKVGGCDDRTWAVDNIVDESEQLYTELRLLSDFDFPLNFTAGASYTYFERNGDYSVYFSSAEVLAQLLKLLDPNFDLATDHFRNETNPYRLNSVGLYGEGYWDVTDTTRATLGLRYTWDEKTHRSRQYLLNGQMPDFQSQEEDWHAVTGRFSIDQQLDFRWSDQSLVYASIARGYKSGGFNPAGAAEVPGVPDSYDPEGIWAYELGTKNEFVKNRLTANLSGFFYDYQDYQLPKLVANTAVNENFDAFVWGLEAEFFARPIDPLGIRFSLAYLGSSIRDTRSIDPADPTAGDPAFQAVKVVSPPGPGFEQFNVGSTQIIPAGSDPFDPANYDPRGGIEKDLDGHELPYTPDVQISIGGDYTLDAPWNGRFIARISYYWQSEMFGRHFNERRDEIDSWSRADAGLRWENDSGNLHAEFWVKNFTDNDDITTHFLADPSGGQFTNVFVLDPRTYGVTVGVRWP